MEILVTKVHLDFLDLREIWGLKVLEETLEAMVRWVLKEIQVLKEERDHQVDKLVVFFFLCNISFC